MTLNISLLHNHEPIIQGEPTSLKRKRGQDIPQTEVKRRKSSSGAPLPRSEEKDAQTSAEDLLLLMRENSDLNEHLLKETKEGTREVVSQSDPEPKLGWKNSDLSTENWKNELLCRVKTLVMHAKSDVTREEQIQRFGNAELHMWRHTQEKREGTTNEEAQLACLNAIVNVQLECWLVEEARKTFKHIGTVCDNYVRKSGDDFPLYKTACDMLLAGFLEDVEEFVQQAADNGHLSVGREDDILGLIATTLAQTGQHEKAMNRAYKISDEGKRNITLSHLAKLRPTVKFIPFDPNTLLNSVFAEHAPTLNSSPALQRGVGP